MNCIPKIVATINKSSVNNNLACELSRLYKIGIQNYRFNLSKFLGSGDIESLCEKIVETKKLLNIPITILFDIPVPYSKPRLFLPHKQKRVMLHKGDDIYITPKHSLISENKNIFGINDPNIARHLLSNAQHTVVYSDGECSFEVQEVFVADDLIRLVANNSWEIQDGKSLTYGMSIDCADHESQYFDAINYVNPEAVAFSFVSSESDIVKYTNSINKGIEIISKIETKEGVENIDEIGKLSHIMLARGDLLLNSDPSELFLLEKKNN